LEETSVLLDNLDNEIEKTIKIAEIVSLDTETPTESIVMFDLVESTGMKKDDGHHACIQKMFLFNQICRFIVNKFKGNVVKDLGDGVLVRFKNPLNSCLAAMNIQYASNKIGVESKAAMTLGMVEEAKINGNIDVFGAVVDRCARIEKCCLPNQILIDRSTFDAVETFLKNYNDVQVGEPILANLKGCGDYEIYEISTKHVTLKKQINV